MTAYVSNGAGVTTSPSRNYPAPSWVVGICQAIGAPVNQANTLLLEFWAQQEGDGVQNNNPFNVAGAGTGAVNCYAQCGGSSGIYSYATMQDGINHNVNQFMLSNPGLAPAVNAMRQGASLSNIYSALNGYFSKQSWAGGTYPTTLYDYLNGGGQGPTSPYSGGATSNYVAGGIGALGGTGVVASTGCASKGNLFGGSKLLGATVIPTLTYCQLKAVLGGLGIVGGGLVMLGGTALLVVGGLGKGGAAAPLVSAALPVARTAQKAAGAPRRRREAKAATAVTAERTANAQSRDRDATIRSSHATAQAVRPAPKKSVSEPQMGKPSTRPGSKAPSTSSTRTNTAKRDPVTRKVSHGAGSGDREF